MTENVLRQADEALEARELIKCRVLQNCADDPGNIATRIAGRVNAELVQLIGRNFLLYRAPKDNRK